MPGSASLSRCRVHLQQRTEIDDGYGNVVAGPFETRCTVWLGLYPARGGETVIAARLAGVQLYDADLRQNSMTRQVTTAWRAVDARCEERVYNIREIVDPTGRREWLRLRLELGVAT